MRLSSFLATALTVALTFALALPSTGCPSDGEECRAYSPPASFNPNEPVSFKEDIFTNIFTKSCQFSACHGSESGSSNGIYLGGLDASKVRTGLVDVPAPELPTMAFVKPGDPDNSYLMRKLDGTQCLLDAQCKDGNCGDSMPRGDVIFDEPIRLTVRRWILQGAPDN